MSDTYVIRVERVPEGMGAAETVFRCHADSYAVIAAAQPDGTVMTSAHVPPRRMMDVGKWVMAHAPAQLFPVIAKLIADLSKVGK